MVPDNIISFIKEVERFKTCLRTCRTTAPGRTESDAEHSWHLALFLLLLRDRLPGLDLERALSLALIHDLPEIYAGDTNPYRGDSSTKARDEAKAAEKLFGPLPEPEGPRLAALFQEYQDQESLEAKAVKALDKLLPLVQNLCTNPEYSSYRRLKVEFPEVKEYMEPFFGSQGIIRELYNRLLEEARTKGVFHDPLSSQDSPET